MHTIFTETEITSSPENIWNILTDFEAYTIWNPLITHATGIAQVGTIINITVQQKSGKKMKFLPKILIAQQNEELRWIGKLFTKGLFAGEHYFRIERLEKNHVRFIHGEIFTGVLVRTQKKMLAELEQGFVEMNLALKRRAEAMDKLKFVIKM